MRIPVLDKNLKPLMPTTPTRARLLLKKGKARAYWNKLGVFCIILKRELEPNNQPIVVGIDPGSRFEGWSVVGAKETILNGMSEAPTHVKDAVAQRREMRRARRHRKCWRREMRFDNRLRDKDTLPSSTFARWNAKLRILVQLAKVLPITDVVVEDIQAETRKGCKRWNSNFSPIEQGKQWFYSQVETLKVRLHLKQGYETKELREKYGLKEISQKDKQTFYSHAVDAWVLAASVSRATKPTNLSLFYWIPIRLHRRQLHRLEPSNGGIRRPYGGTRSMGISRGTLVRHVKYGLTYIGGTLKGRVSLHCIQTGKRVTQGAKISDLEILTRLSWRGTLLPGLKAKGFRYPCTPRTL